MDRLWSMVGSAALAALWIVYDTVCMLLAPLLRSLSFGLTRVKSPNAPLLPLPLPSKQLRIRRSASRCRSTHPHFGMMRPVAVTRYACIRRACHRYSLSRAFTSKPSPAPPSPSSSSAAPPPSPPSRVAVVGGGQMGTGIAYVTSVVARIPVTIVDSSASQLERSRSFITTLLDKDVSKGRLDASAKQQALQRFSFTPHLQQLVDEELPFIIEAVTERFDVKSAILHALKGLPASSIVATNTSSISITKLAACAAHPFSVVGMHFMNPVPVMKLVEVIPALQTSAATLSATLQLASLLGKTTTTSRDVPGFVANRLLMPYINEAAMAYADGVASREDIDRTMVLGTAMPMGPLTLADFIGLDTCLSIMEVLHEGFGDSKYRPAPVLRQYVDAGWLGKKSGRGFYTYDAHR